MREAPSESTIAARYALLERLGAGGMGEVYRARDLRLEREVAVKLVRADRLTDGMAQARLLREARAAAALSHPGVVQVHDVGQTEEGHVYVVMELVRGSSLAARILARPPSATESVELVREIALVLDAAHAAGIVHRDVKPENVMLREDGRVVLLDFGLATSASPSAEGAARLTAEGAVLGTVAYMAPEQARGLVVDARADQFSLAVLAYELLAGQLPWDAVTVQALFAALLTDPPRKLAAVAPWLPAALEPVLERALAKSPAERFASAGDFAKALAAVPGLDSVVSPGPSARVPAATRPASSDALAETLDASSAPPWVTAPTLSAAPAGAAPPSEPASAAPIPAAAAAQPAEPAREAPGPGRRRAWPLLLVLALALAVVGALRLRARGLGVSSPRVLACVPLQVLGETEDTRWMGAAAASLACRRALWSVGGRPERALTPAALLDIPRRISSSSPDDPYSAPGARARALGAARSRAEAWIDGTLAHSDEGFVVRLTLESPSGVLARGEGRGRVLAYAVRDASEPLLRRVGVAPLDPEVQRWRLLGEGAQGLAYEDALTEHSVEPLRPGHCARFSRFREQLGAAWYEWGTFCQDALGAGALPLDESSVPRLASTAPNSRDAAVRASALARLDAAMAREASAPARAALGLASSALHLESDPGRTRELLFLALESDPLDRRLWDDLGDALGGAPNSSASAWAFASWVPEEPFAWLLVAAQAPSADASRRLRFASRGYAVAPTSPTAIRAVSARLLALQRVEDLRALAAEVAAEPTLALLGEGLRVNADVLEGSFSQARSRAEAGFWRAVQELPLGARADYSDTALLRLSLELGLLAGDPVAFADRVSAELLEVEPPRIQRGTHAVGLPQVCTLTSPARRRACGDRLEALRQRGYLTFQNRGDEAYLAGAIAAARGDTAAAVRAFRGIVRFTRVPNLLAPVFESAGEWDLAELADEPQLRADAVTSLRGASLSVARAAVRAERRGEIARARELAARLVTAWGDVDIPVPAVAEMRALLARTAAPPPQP